MLKDYWDPLRISKIIFCYSGNYTKRLPRRRWWALILTAQLRGTKRHEIFYTSLPSLLSFRRQWTFGSAVSSLQSCATQKKNRHRNQDIFCKSHVDMVF